MFKNILTKKTMAVNGSRVPENKDILMFRVRHKRLSLSHTHTLCSQRKVKKLFEML